MQTDVHKTLYPFYTIMKMLYFTAEVTKIVLRWQQCFFSFILLFTQHETTWLTATTVFLHYLPMMSAFNSHTR